MASETAQAISVYWAVQTRDNHLDLTGLGGWHDPVSTTEQRLERRAECPAPSVRIEGDDIILTFGMNPFQFPRYHKDDVGVLRFLKCRRYRLGATNDEGWYRGQCRFSKVAPTWGEFYEVSGELLLNKCPDDWVVVSTIASGTRHFLFYFRDETFECDAIDWHFSAIKSASTGAGR
jgi:hypothetical protein